MVRFSDMLGGSGEPERERATDSPYAALASDDLDPGNDEAPEPEAGEPEAGEPEAGEPEAGEPEAPGSPPAPGEFETPEEVLERLERYATSARTETPPAPTEPPPPAPTEPPPPPPAGPAEAADDVPPGDDFLPHPKEVVHRPGWGRKRRP